MRRRPARGGVCVPAVRRQGVHATWLHKPRGRRHGPPAPGGSIERGEVKVARETFGAFWARLLEERRPYLTTGSFADFEAHGRKRLLPTFSTVPLTRIDEDLVRAWLATMAELVDAGDISAKTTNNARTCLSVALNDACRRGLIARNPCAAVPPLPLNRRELDYLRLNEIEPYVSACMTHYRPLAQFLIGTGVRVSEALVIRFRHIALDDAVVRVYGQRGRDGSDSRPTKSKRFRSVQIGPALIRTPRRLPSAACTSAHRIEGTRRRGRSGSTNRPTRSCLYQVNRPQVRDAKRRAG